MKLKYLCAISTFAFLCTAQFAFAYTSEEKIADKPLPRLVIDSPMQSASLAGTAVIKFHTENINIKAAFGAAAFAPLAPSGHLHVTIDNNTWLWIYTSEDPIILVGLSNGEHKIQLQLADGNHHVLDTQMVSFLIVPPAPPSVKKP